MSRKRSKKGWFDWATGASTPEGEEPPATAIETGKLNQTLDELDGLIAEAEQGAATGPDAENAAAAEAVTDQEAQPSGPAAMPIPLLEDYLEDAPGEEVAPIRGLAQAIDSALSERALSELGAQHLYQELVQELEEVLRTSLAQVQRDMEQALQTAVRSHVDKAIKHMAEAARRDPPTDAD